MIAKHWLTPLVYRLKAISWRVSMAAWLRVRQPLPHPAMLQRAVDRAFRIAVVIASGAAAATARTVWDVRVVAAAVAGVKDQAARAVTQPFGRNTLYPSILGPHQTPRRQRCVPSTSANPSYPHGDPSLLAIIRSDTLLCSDVDFASLVVLNMMQRTLDLRPTTSTVTLPSIVASHPAFLSSSSFLCCLPLCGW